VNDGDDLVKMKIKVDGNCGVAGLEKGTVV
jgi:hypothetical protein